MVLIQKYNTKTGFKLFVDKGEKAVTKRLTQIHNMETSVSMYSTKLTKQERVEALLSLKFLVEKRDGRAKAIGCVDGKK